MFYEIQEQCEFSEEAEGGEAEEFDVICKHEKNNSYNGTNGSGFCYAHVCPINIKELT